jgi:hypothetical protein
VALPLALCRQTPTGRTTLQETDYTTAAARSSAILSLR